MGSRIDLTGRAFGRLTVLHRAPPLRGRTAWACACECGQSAIVQTGALTSANTQSCGCIRREQLSARVKRHGMTRTGTHSVWQAMRKRCRDPNSEDYRLYGGRGISVCERWQTFENFLADMGPKPSPTHSIDRYPDTNGNYEPDNCRWATPLEQANNTSRNRRIEFRGETLTLAQWARRLNFKPYTIHSRIKCGWSVERALTTPLRVWS